MYKGPNFRWTHYVQTSVSYIFLSLKALQVVSFNYDILLKLSRNFVDSCCDVEPSRAEQLLLLHF